MSFETIEIRYHLTFQREVRTGLVQEVDGYEMLLQRHGTCRTTVPTSLGRVIDTFSYP